MAGERIDVGPLEPLLADAGITAIYVHVGGEVHFEKGGVTHLSTARFESDSQRLQVIKSIVSAGGKTLAAHAPVVDCVLADGTRAHAEYEPPSMSLHKAR
jgi:pilus assembly protein CpaF